MQSFALQTDILIDIILLFQRTYKKLNVEPRNSKKQVRQSQTADANVGDGVELPVHQGDGDHGHVEDDDEDQEDGLDDEMSGRNIEDT